MASFSIDLLRSKKRSDGKIQIVAHISANGNSIFRTGIFVSEDEWDSKKKLVTGKNARPYNLTLDIIKVNIQTIFNNLLTEGKLKTAEAKDIKQMVEASGNTPTPKNQKNIMAGENNAYFFDFTTELLERINKKRTREAYAAPVKKAREFYESENAIGSSDELTFNHVDVAFVKRFDLWMEKNKLVVNSRSVHLRHLRKLYNDAIDENMASLEAYPFRRFKIKNEETKHRNMEVADLITLRDYECEPHQKKYVDMFFLGFYLVGINLIDLCNLTKIEKTGRIEYRRAKTGRLYSIKVEPEAQALIEKYAGEDYLIDVMERYADHASYLARLNKNLKEIGTVDVGKKGKKTRKPLFDYLSWYYTRHTWATIASELDIPDDTIRLALGHGAKTVTDVYIKRNLKKIDDANRRVIDYVNNYVPEDEEKSESKN
jgi:hypothetical protein